MRETTVAFSGWSRSWSVECQVVFSNRLHHRFLSRGKSTKTPRPKMASSKGQCHKKEGPLLLRPGFHLARGEAPTGASVWKRKEPGKSGSYILSEAKGLQMHDRSFLQERFDWMLERLDFDYRFIECFQQQQASESKSASREDRCKDSLFQRDD